MSNRIMELRSDTRMSSAPGIDKRLTDLEIKATFTEDLLDQLDKVIARQQQQIDLMARELRELRQPVADQNDSAPRNPRDDMPPHF
jgi:SlyX protein